MFNTTKILIKIPTKTFISNWYTKIVKYLTNLQLNLNISFNDKFKYIF